MNQEKQPIGVIGVGWVGLVTAACFAELGHPVIARDIVEEKVDSLSRGEVSIHEPGLEDLLRTLTNDQIIGMARSADVIIPKKKPKRGRSGG